MEENGSIYAMCGRCKPSSLKIDNMRCGRKEGEVKRRQREGEREEKRRQEKGRKAIDRK